MDTPEYWQKRYLQGEDGWDKGRAAPPLLEFLETHRLGGDILVPGCGAGHDVRALARAGARATGMDFAPAAIERARSFPAVPNATFVPGDFLNLPETFSGKFDAVFEHTLFCAIPPHRRPDYVRSCLRALRPDGCLLAVFYLEPGHPEGPPWGVTRAELDALFAPSFRLLLERVPTRAYEGREWRELLRLYSRKNLEDSPARCDASAR